MKDERVMKELEPYKGILKEDMRLVPALLSFENCLFKIKMAVPDIKFIAF